MEGGGGDKVSAGAGGGRGGAVTWANGGVRVAEGANGVGDNAEECVMANGGFRWRRATSRFMNYSPMEFLLW